MSVQFWAGNGAEPTTASRVAVATGTSIKTLLQIAVPSTIEIIPVAWGISFDASAAGVPGIIELIETDVAATSGTSLTPTKYSNPSSAQVSLCVGGTGATCFSPSTEGTIAAVRTADVEQVCPTNQFAYQWPLGREFRVAISKFLRVRVKFAATVNAICWVQWEE
jgi:hypothetical protein